MIADSTRERARDAVDDFLFWLAQKRKRKPRHAPDQEVKNPLPDDRPKYRKADVILAWLAEKGEATTSEICDEFGMNPHAFHAMSGRYKTKFVKAGEAPSDTWKPQTVWKVAR